MHVRFASALAACLLLVTGARAMPADVTGRWETGNGKSHIEIRPCGEDRRCGQIVWLATPLDPRGEPKRDDNNEDSQLRRRTLIGLELMGDFAVDDENEEWSGGWIYNPRDGQRYSAILKRRSADELLVRGFLGLRLFGKTEVWRRVADAPTAGKD